MVVNVHPTLRSNSVINTMLWAPVRPKYMDVRMPMVVMMMLMNVVSVSCGRLFCITSAIVVVEFYPFECFCSMYIRNMVLNLPQLANPLTSSACTINSGCCVAVFCTIGTLFKFSSFIGVVFINTVHFA